ncbi:MAG: LON peptidase substrate-binding domain-containing protein [Leptospira sp.]|nr:LON peptidase substrate-binding domain-containing protein [Leptospira sp.]
MSVFSIPIFPLPEIILFPGAFLPLHIFEPRYRQMLDYCLESGNLMGIASFRKDWQNAKDSDPPIEDIFGWGEILQKDSLFDGRSNIVIQGRGIAKVSSYKSLHPFRIADVIEIEMDQSFRQKSEFNLILQELILLTKRMLLRAGADESFLLSMSRTWEHEFPVEFISSLLDIKFELKYELLITTDYIIKAKKLLGVLRELNLNG